MKVTKAHIASVVEKGNWIIRADNDGESYGGFRWAPLGEWTEASDWDPAPRCGGGLHGQDKDNGGYISGNRLLFCETEGEHVAIDKTKIKVKRARILMIDNLPDGLTVGGYLDLSGCTGLTSLPDGLTVGGSLYLGRCTGLTSLPDGLTVGGSLYLGRCTGLVGK